VFGIIALSQPDFLHGLPANCPDILISVSIVAAGRIRQPAVLEFVLATPILPPSFAVLRSEFLL